MSEHQPDIYDRFAQVTKQTHDLVANMEKLQAQITELMEKNAELSIENDHLRSLLKKSGHQQQGNHLSGSRENLKKLYQQGFHVCSEYFGERLSKNESCAFCDRILFLDTNR
ncbi:DNA replication initiation control protein YabA [Lactobacillaceae bacterium 24-114]